MHAKLLARDTRIPSDAPLGASSAVPSWLWVPEVESEGTRVVLPAEEARYVTRVCRARPGDRVVATDGRGTVAELELESVASAVAARVMARSSVPRGPQAWVLCGATEGTRADWLVEKLAELGVSRFQPLDCDRQRHRTARLERWRKLAVAALRQSRRAWLLEVAEPVAIEPAAASVPEAAARWLASQSGDPVGDSSLLPALSVVAIGPSTGFTDGEARVLVSAGFAPARLAAARLRTETAALVWAGTWASRCAGAGPGPMA